MARRSRIKPTRRGPRTAGERRATEATASSSLDELLLAAMERGIAAPAEVAEDSPIVSIDPEYFVFADGTGDYLRGFMRAAEVLARDLGGSADLLAPELADEQV